MSVHKWTARRVEILDLLSQGFTDRQIGNILKLSTHTIRGHRKAILKMLEVSTAGGAVGEAFRRGILKCDNQ